MEILEAVVEDELGKTVFVVPAYKYQAHELVYDLTGKRREK